jgi:thiamine-phosphate pyrophosphorylase
MRLTLPPIYPITDKTLARRESHLSILTELVRGGARLIQIRDKSTPIQDLLKDLRRCVDFAASRGITLIVNDRCDLALSCGAMGVHLGQDDLPPEAARKIFGRRKIIGYSAHSLAQVRKAQLLPIDYIGFGPVFPTATKCDAAPAAGLQHLAKACKASVLPVVAIGGIDLDQVQEVLRAGASSAAVISALMKAKNLARRMECFLEKAMAI